MLRSPPFYPLPKIVPGFQDGEAALRGKCPLACSISTPANGAKKKLGIWPEKDVIPSEHECVLIPNTIHTDAARALGTA
jgi:hypothetical protein